MTKCICYARGKLFFTMLFFAAAGVSFRAAAQAALSQHPSSQASAERTFKNIQVLKDIPSDQLIPAMQFISASLGVECGFCHVENRFDLDDKKPKAIARKMMLMVMSVNQNNFDSRRKVTCNTCHRGSPLPEAIPAISETPSFPRTQGGSDEQPLPNLPSATELLAKYVTASGGQKALQSVSTRAEKGTANFMGREIAVDIYDKAPNKRASFMHLPNGDSATIFNGQQGWTTAPRQNPRDMPASELQSAMVDADLQFALHVQEMFPNLQPAHPENVAGRETYQLLSENKGEPRIRLYFDQQTGLLLRMVRYGESPLGLNPVRVDYGDYRLVDGVQVPYRWTVARPFRQFTIQLTEVKQNSEIDDSKFTKPAGLQASEVRP